MNKEQLEELESDIKRAYEEGVTVDDAEKLAAKFLHAQMTLNQVLRDADLDARMRKTGVKAIRAAVYLAEVQKSDKKPSDTLLEQIVNTDVTVRGEQESLDSAEVDRSTLQNYYNIFHEAHIYFRTIAKQVT